MDDGGGGGGGETKQTQQTDNNERTGQTLTVSVEHGVESLSLQEPMAFGGYTALSRARTRGAISCAKRLDVYAPVDRHLDP